MVAVRVKVEGYERINFKLEIGMKQKKKDILSTWIFQCAVARSSDIICFTQKEKSMKINEMK